jgi:hypothetical protein
MSKRQYVLTLLAAVIAGLVGGAVGSRLFVTESAYTQREKVIQAQGFILADTDGKARAILGFLQREPFLAFFDKAGKARTTLHLNSDGEPFFRLQNDKELAGILLGVVKEAASVEMYGQNTKRNLLLTVRSGGAPALGLFDDDGTARAVLGQIELETTHTGTKEKRAVSSLVLFDKDKKILWAVP